MPDQPFQVGDKLRYKTWAQNAPAYTVLAIAANGTLYCQTQEQRPYTRMIRPDEIKDFERVSYE